MEKIMLGLDDAVESFIGFLEQLPAKKLEPVSPAKWGAKEVLCHLVFWHEQYCAILHALIKKQKPDLLNGTFKELNRTAVLMNNHETIPSLFRRLRHAQDELEYLCLQPGASDVRIAFRNGSMYRPLPVAMQKIENHFRSHRRQLGGS